MSKLVLCPIIRESDGLAMSSRNIYLSPSERKNALALFKALSKTKELFKTKTISQIKNELNPYLSSAPGIELEYFEIFNANSFKAVTSRRSSSLIALVAAKVGSIRIIDNMILK